MTHKPENPEVIGVHVGHYHRVHVYSCSIEGKQLIMFMDSINFAQQWNLYLPSKNCVFTTNTKPHFLNTNVQL